MKAKLPDLSVIVVTRNTRQLLNRCLASLRALPDVVELETIVVDNGSSDGTLEMLGADFHGIHVVRNERNTGFAYPNNQGIRVSTGRHVLLLNSDTVVSAGALEQLVGFLDRNPNVGAVGPRLVYPDESHQPSCLSFHTPWRLFCDMSGIASLLPRSRIFGNQQRAFDYDKTGPAEALMGAALMVRRPIIESVGVLDETFSIYANEIDWCYRIHQAGWDCVYVHDATIMHEMGGTLRTENVNFRLQGEMLKNYFDYYEKYYGSLGVIWFRFWTGIGYGLRAMWYPIRNHFWPSQEGEKLARLAPFMVKAAWTGTPEGTQPTSEQNLS